jgi:thiol-disulfide isomerase/thioredoxin
MSIDRLSKVALQRILAGKVNQEATCVIKFYSNNCPLCHKLSDPYKDLAEKENYSDLHFFAFNIADYPRAAKVMGFKGVPTITLVKTGSKKPKIRVLKDPEKPYENMWYNPKDIEEFIEKER